MCPCLDVREYAAHKKTNLGSAAFLANITISCRCEMIWDRYGT